MTDEQRALAEFRLEQASQMIKDARMLFAANSFRSALNRAYYAMFYAASALLATEGLGASRHSGVISLLHREFVKPGRFPAEIAGCIDAVFALRNESDYEDYYATGSDEAESSIEMAVRFVETARNVLDQL